MQPAFELLAHAGRRQYHFKSGYPIHQRDHLDGVSIDFLELRTTVTTQKECGQLISYLMIAAYCLPHKEFVTCRDTSECHIKTNQGSIARQDYPLTISNRQPAKSPWYNIESRIRSRGQCENLITWLLQHHKCLPGDKSLKEITMDDLQRLEYTPEQPATYDGPRFPADFKGDEPDKFNFRQEWTTGHGLEQFGKQGKTPEDQPPQ